MLLGLCALGETLDSSLTWLASRPVEMMRMCVRRLCCCWAVLLLGLCALGEARHSSVTWPASPRVTVGWRITAALVPEQR